MVAFVDLGKTLSQEDTCVILDLYTAALSKCTEADAGAEIPFAATNTSSCRYACFPVWLSYVP